MTKHEEIEKLLNKINKAFNAGLFLNYIEYIRYPFYKNLEKDSIIQFNFPITIFTGQNGSGKSSTLHSIYGAPDGYSTGNFWFSTKVDPIEEGDGNPNCFIYGYKNINSEIIEVLKTRIKTHNADYWEPSRPLKKYSMNRYADGSRNPAIKKDVKYLDFRAELSAYDKYFYFGSFNSSKTLKSKQDVIRKTSHYLKDIIDNSNIIQLYNKKKNHLPIDLIQEEITYISKILNKSYSQCKLIRHTLFNSLDSLTIFFRTNIQNYSEAFAGRGEFAVVKLVHEVIHAANYSLIILDEPEVSLHPGAQEELKIFLLEQILKKKLQVVISTHSPKIVEFFPDSAIKLFYQIQSGKFQIKNNCHYKEAFAFIGHKTNDGEKIIIVEDIASQTLIERILEKMGAPYNLIFKVKYYPGGGEEILKKAVTYSEENENHKYLLLDGDKKKDKIDISQMLQEDINDFSKLEQYIFTGTGIEFKKLPFRINSFAGSGDVEQKKSSSIQYFNFLYTNLDFLPSNTPEELIWDKEFVDSLLKLKKSASIKFSSDYKENVVNSAILFFGDKSQSAILSMYKLLIDRFIEKANVQYQEITSIINKFHN